MKDDDDDENHQKSHNEKNGSASEMSSEKKLLDGGSDDGLIGEKRSQSEFLRKVRWSVTIFDFANVYGQLR